MLPSLGNRFWTKCPSCHGSQTVSRARLHRLPILLFPVDAELRSEVPRRTLNIRGCISCGHEFAPGDPQGLLKSIYEDWYRYYPMHADEIFDVSYRNPMDTAIDSAISAFGKPPIRVLEIGANNVAALSRLIELGHDVFGVSPDAPNNDERFLRSRVEDLKSDEKFDLIISRFTLEHIVDLDTHLRVIKRLLSPEGCYLVQVPNCEQWRFSGVVSYFAHEHRHYFSHLSAAILFHRNGFHYNFESQPEDSSVIIQGRITRRDTKSPGKNLESLVAEAVSRGPTFFYGAGLPLIRWIYSGRKRGSDSGNIRLVDDNQALHGRFLPGTDLMVEAPSAIENLSATTVIMTINPTHHEIVRSKLRKLAPHVTVVVGY